jgi:predicted enzyme related to lactoylglutathione lyase
VKPTGFIVNVTSEDPHRLTSFYRNIVGLPPNPNIGEEAFEIGPNTSFVIDGHSEIKGPAKEPARVLINFFVDDLKAEQARLKEQGVKFIREEGQEYWGGTISTFLDPDGNYVQLMEYNPA